MSRDKQTEIMELARELCGEGEQHIDCFHCPTLRCCGMQKFARELYAKGYRKSTDLAEEIFAEIDTLFEEHFKIYRDRGRDVDLEMVAKHSARFSINELWGELAELKKKYTEGENHDGN